MKTTTGYGAAQIALHWLIAVGVLFNYIVSDAMGKALHQRLDGQEITVAIAPYHVWAGVALMVLVVVRLVLRVTNGAPARDPGPLGLLAAAMHGALYLLIVLVPLAGGLAWFAGIEALGDVHALLANVLMIVAGLHAAAGLYHGLVLKDGVMRRMLRPA